MTYDEWKTTPPPPDGPDLEDDGERDEDDELLFLAGALALAPALSVGT